MSLSKRKRSVIAQTGGMLATILVLVLLESLTLPIFIIVSYLVFIGLIYQMRMLELSRQVRRRLIHFVVAGGILSVAVVAFQLVQSISVIQI